MSFDPPSHKLNTRICSTHYSLTNDDDFVLMDFAGGVIYLHSALTARVKSYTLKNMHATGSMVIQPAAGEAIDFNTVLGLSKRFASVIIVPSSGYWWIQGATGYP